jgi:glycosyltransferase involved in cell wall biosynthesis
MRVLYVNHTSTISGAERSLLTLLAGLPPHVSPVLACPPGPLEEAAAREGLQAERFRGTAGSLRLHPWHTPRAIAEIGAAVVRLRRLAREVGADLVHANTIRAGLVATLAPVRGGPPAVVHVRDCLPPGRVSALTQAVIRRRAAALLFNSAYTRDRFLTNAASGLARVAYSPVDLDRFDPATIDRDQARAAVGVDGSGPVLSLIAQVSPWKAQDDALRIVAMLKPRHPTVRLLVAGSAKFVSGATRYDNQAYLRSLRLLAAELDIEEQVSFLGERDDVPRVLRAADLALLPSWEEPFGRSIVEAMAMGVPVVATAVGGPAEILDSGEAGILLAPRDPGAWARVIAELIEQPDRRAAMGEAARREARRFALTTHVDAVLDTYREVLAGGLRPRP